MLKLYRSGRDKDGWCCHSCHEEFWHGGHPLPVFLSLQAHVLVAHHRLAMRSMGVHTCPSPARSWMEGSVYYWTSTKAVSQ